MSEQESFPERELASLVVSKVYYHLGSFSDSLTYALAAGHKFDVNGMSEYIETILCKCFGQDWWLAKMSGDGVSDMTSGSWLTEVYCIHVV